MNQDLIRYKIDQLRQDKILYATEAVVVCVLALVGLTFSAAYFEGVTKTIVDVWCLAWAMGYSLFMAIGNFLRYQKIRTLERLVK